MIHRPMNAFIIFLIFPLAVLLLFLRQPAKRTYSQMETPTANSYFPYVSVPPAPTPTPTATAAPPEGELIEQETASGLNMVRGDHGLPALVLVDELTQSARRHSRDMADNHGSEPRHIGSDDTNGCERMLQAGYHWSTCAEIIGWGFGGSTERMIDWWMNSPDHRDIILSSKYEDFGVGHVVDHASYWGHYWTVNFGKRASASTALSGELHKCTYRLDGPQGGSSLLLYTREPCPQPVSHN